MYCFVFLEKRKIDGRKGAVKTKWTQEENEIVLSFFKVNIETRTVPSKAMVETAMQEYRILKRRSWLTIRAKVRNTYLKNEVKEKHY